MIEKTIKDRDLTVLNELYSSKPDICCFSSYIWNIDRLLSFASRLKRLLPNTVIVFGGPEAGSDGDWYVERYPFIDFVIGGEGEEALPELCRKISIESAERVKKAGRVISGGIFSRFTETGIAYSDYESFTSNILYYESSRGCPYNCGFCLSSATDGVRMKDADSTLKDIAEFEKLSNIKIIKFVDRTFNCDRSRARIIWKALISPEFTKSYHFEIRPELIGEEDIELFKQMPPGKIQLEAGIQSTMPEAVSACGRGGNIEKALNALKMIKSCPEVSLHADLIAGLPFESYDRFGRSFDDVYPICDKLQLGFLKLLRGSPLRAEAEKYGIVYSPDAPYEVLKTNALSFDELIKLHRISDLCERYSVSGRFSMCLPALISLARSPFEFFDGMADHPGCANINGVSQIKAYELLYSYASEKFALPFSENAALYKTLICLDYLTYESGQIPRCLSDVMYETVGGEEKSRLLRELSAPGLFFPAVIVCEFNALPGVLYVIDRQNHVRYTRKRR